MEETVLKRKPSAAKFRTLRPRGKGDRAKLGGEQTHVGMENAKKKKKKLDVKRKETRFLKKNSDKGRDGSRSKRTEVGLRGWGNDRTEVGDFGEESIGNIEVGATS